MGGAAVKSISIHRLAIPLRRPVEHAASRRSTSEPVVVAVELNSGGVGYGETLPRAYVTGETVESVADAIERLYAPALLAVHPRSFAEALEAVEALPWQVRDPGGVAHGWTPAARAAVELALLDAFSRHFRRPISDAVGWMGFHDFGWPGSLRRVRHSGVLASRSVTGTRRSLRLMWWYGLRDFKVKVADDGDDERLRAVADYLARPLGHGRATLRIDANGAWTLPTALKKLAEWRDLNLSVVEQPLPKHHEDDLVELKACVHQPLMCDESLVTMEDAKRLVERQVADGFNVRISKCGGLLPSLRLAKFAQRNGIMIQLGCMVGETSILSSAGRRFLELVPGVQFAEGSFGRFLLRDDVVRRPVRFGYGGRGGPLPGLGWGIVVDPDRLAAHRVSETTLVL